MFNRWVLGLVGSLNELYNIYLVDGSVCVVLCLCCAVFCCDVFRCGALSVVCA